MKNLSQQPTIGPSSQSSFIEPGLESGIPDCSHEVLSHQVCGYVDTRHTYVLMCVHGVYTDACVQKVCDMVEQHRTKTLSSDPSFDKSPMALEILSNFSGTRFSSL